MKNPTKDERYSVRKEFCGQYHKEKKRNLKQGQMFVARFCGDYLGCGETESKAWLLCIFHQDERMYKLLV